MNPDYRPVFNKYQELCKEADLLFSTIGENFPQCVTCQPGCSDCCHALFDLSLVEAMHINKAFTEKYGYGPERSQILQRASDQDRHLTKLKRELFRAEKNGEAQDKIMTMAASTRMRCPLLDDNDRCLLYEERPITCRLYGVPLAIASKAHVCGFSHFDKGKAYPTVHMEKIQKRLDDMSAEIAQASGSPYDLSDIYVPLSMALLTSYDSEWFGTDKSKEVEKS